MASGHRIKPTEQQRLPQNPQPFSVISEHWQDQLHVHDTDDDLFSFGHVYEENLYKLIHKHLELDTHDRFAYVGSSKGSYAEKIKEKFCLLQPIVNIFSGAILYEEAPNQQRMLPFKIDHIGAEQYFQELSEGLTKGNKEPPFDKIILHGAFEHFTYPKQTFAHIMRTLTKEGKLLIMHRPAPMSTLPFFTEANKRFIEEDRNDPYLKILRSLQSQKVDVKWDIEVLPIIMPKVKWLSMLNKKFPPQMEIISSFEISTGLRELTEGMLKYQGEQVEFFDRLMFIAVSYPFGADGYPSIQRHGASDVKPYPGLMDLKYSLEVTPDIQKHVREIQSNRKKPQNNIFG